MADYVVVATWPFGLQAVRKAAEWLQQGKPALDAAIAGAQVVEDDPKVHSVGFAGLANCGAVAGLENVRHPAALARRVMEKTPHVLLVGEGARLFAQQQGFPLEMLSTPDSVAEWEKLRDRQRQRSGGGGAAPLEHHNVYEDHDTIAVLARDQKGSLAGVCTTSGLAMKLPGRVGDSPLIGHGLYVDNNAGAAGGTGVGEEVIRAGGSLLIVEAMRDGKSPQEACELAVRRVNRFATRRGVHPASVAFLALDPRGRVGAASTERTNFQYAVARDGKAELLKAPEIGVEEK